MAKMTKAQKAAAARRRNRFKGINVTDAALGYAGVAIWSDALLQVSPIQFFTDKTGGGSSWAITGRELLDGLMGGAGGVYAGGVTKGYYSAANPFAVIQANASKHGVEALVKTVGLGVAGTVGKKVTRKPRAFLNKTIRQFGLGEWIRF